MCYNITSRTKNIPSGSACVSTGLPFARPLYPCGTTADLLMRMWIISTTNFLRQCSLNTFRAHVTDMCHITKVPFFWSISRSISHKPFTVARCVYVRADKKNIPMLPFLWHNFHRAATSQRHKKRQPLASCVGFPHPLRAIVRYCGFSFVPVFRACYPGVPKQVVYITGFGPYLPQNSRRLQ
ncbi:hypothetical protein TRVL_07718 [Trypanosoma vivax]|nr:hypothetical protein TRVL_07718 [Trypanosoma vivax]